MDGELRPALGDPVQRGDGSTRILIGRGAQRGDMAILLVEQYFDFARDLADHMAVMDRGQIVLSGRSGELDGEEVRRRIQI